MTSTNESDLINAHARFRAGREVGLSSVINGTLHHDHRIIRYRMRALSRDRSNLTKKFALINPPFWIFFKNYRLLLHKMSGRAHFALINPPFCGDNFDQCCENYSKKVISKNYNYKLLFSKSN